MPRRWLVRSLPTLLVLVALAGCSRHPAPTAPPDAPATQAGWLSGFVIVETSCGEPVLDRGGVIVSLEGTGRSTTTDASGTWRFDDLPFGTYDLSFSKPGLSSFKALAYQFDQSGQAQLSWFEGLVELPAGIVSNLAAETASVDGVPGVRVTFDVTPACPSGPYQALLVLGDDESVAADQYVITSGVQHSDTGHFDLFYPSADLAWNGLARGSRLYARAYDARNAYYWNNRTQTLVFPAISAGGSGLTGCVVP